MIDLLLEYPKIGSKHYILYPMKCSRTLLYHFPDKVFVIKIVVSRLWATIFHPTPIFLTCIQFRRIPHRKCGDVPVRKMAKLQIKQK